MRRVLASLLPNGWELAGYVLIGVAVACLDRGTRQDVARENWANANMETTEAKADGVPGIS